MSTHFVSMRVSNDLIVSSRIYIALVILFCIYLFCLRTLERCALVATALAIYRTFPDRVGSFCEVLLLSFRTALWITLIDYCGEENCKTYYESDLVGLCKLRFCNCLRSGFYFTKGEEVFACTDRYRVSSLRPGKAPALRFEANLSPGASREIGPLRDYLNVLRSRTGSGVMVVFDEESAFADDCQRVFKEITRLMRFEESYAELLAPRKRELLAPVRVWDKGVILPGAWIMCTGDYTLVFQDLDDAEESLCEIMTKSGKKMYRSIFASRLFELERILPGLLCVVRLENFGLVTSGWFFWGMNILHSSSFDELFKYLLSGREVFVTRLSSAGQSTLVLGRKPKFLPAWFGSDQEIGARGMAIATTGEFKSLHNEKSCFVPSNLEHSGAAVAFSPTSLDVPDVVDINIGSLGADVCGTKLLVDAQLMVHKMRSSIQDHQRGSET